MSPGLLEDLEDESEDEEVELVAGAKGVKGELTPKDSTRPAPTRNEFNSTRLDSRLRGPTRLDWWKTKEVESQSLRVIDDIDDGRRLYVRVRKL